MPKLPALLHTERSVFITSVTHNRQAVFQSDEDRDLLVSTMRSVQAIAVFHLLAYAILPDHVHLLMRTDITTDFSRVMHSIKRNFTLNYKRLHGINTASVLWQSKFWDHIIRDEDDLTRHLDYIHYNVVKHGLVVSPGDWKHSTYSFWKERGFYSDQWGLQEPPMIANMTIE